MEHEIQILSTEIANKIAAGEVVQRPLSVVKELVENSIDAKATNIKIILSNSGLDKIQVIDNGIGMNEKNAKLCLVRHATSKVKTEEDIYRIITLGFRGEALPSIAAVSLFSLLTSPDGKVGYEIIKDGLDEKFSEKPANKGTEITVKNLFYNTPARFKHLSSTFYELSLIIKYVNKAALTNPNIKFELINNENTIFSSLGDGSIKNVLHKIYSSSIAKNLLEFSAENSDFKVNFYIVKPQITRAKKDNMHIGVNKRIIKNMAIENMILKGYGTYLHTNQYPIVFLDIETESSLIDINIHPTKEQIKISLLNRLEELIISSISSALNKEEYISKPQIEEVKNTSFEQSLQKKEINLLNNLFEDKKKEVVETLKEQKSNYQIEVTKENNQQIKNIIKEENIIEEVDRSQKEEDKIDKGEDYTKGIPDSLFSGISLPNNSENSKKIKDKREKLIDESIVEEISSQYQQNEEKIKHKINNEVEKVKDVQNYNNEIIESIVNIDSNNNNNDIFEDYIKENQTLIQNGKYIGNHHNTYLLYENEKGIYFVDQHAAQERIRYEMLLEKFSQKQYKFQKMLIPHIFEFTQDEFILIENKLPVLEELGLIFDKFGHNTLRLLEVESFYLKFTKLEKELRYIIDTVIYENKLSYVQIVDEIAISMACKGSIKAHNYITQNDATSLLSQLSKCKEPYTCPHGRPIIVTLDNYQIQKLFKRVN